MSQTPADPTLAEARRVLEAALGLLEPALDRAREITDAGKRIDDHQPLTERVAYAATEARAARELLELTERTEAEGRGDPHLRRTATAGVALLAGRLRDRLEPALDELGLPEEALEGAFPAEVRALVRRLAGEAQLRALGRVECERGGRNDTPLDETLEQVREEVRRFAEETVAPEAQRIHLTDALVPDSIVEKMGELGYFGLSIPEEYGGTEFGNLPMILTTEELSRASLAAAGSLITRPEILAKALLGGGTEEQKRKWLPRIASGELMVGISVTEPDVGSDVASVKCRAEPATVDGVPGFALSGAKAWCTFAGRADILAVLARTEPDPGLGARGLSLFIVPKERAYGHEFAFEQPGGGRISGKADATPGYRGMHSFTLHFENYFVPADHLVGGEEGRGRGFYLQMAGFAAGRLQTGGRACGLAQAALEETIKQVRGRTQFGQPISEFQLTQFTIGRMKALLAASRAITYRAALAMDEDPRAAAPLAAQAKLVACDAAVEITQAGQILHGGWGYAEEYPICRYVLDALVLPIFEGVKPVLELKVVGRSLLAG